MSKEPKYKFDALSNKEKQYAQDFYDNKKVQVSRIRLLFANISLIVAILTLAGMLITAYSFVKEKGAKDAKIKSLFEPNNPVVKHKELVKEISNVRHDMGVSNTSINSKYADLKKSISDFKKEQKDFRRDINKKMEKQTDRLIEVIKSTK